MTTADVYPCDAGSCVKLDCVDCAEQLFDGYDVANSAAFAERAGPGRPGFPPSFKAPCLFLRRPGGATGSDLLGVPRSGSISTVGAHELQSADCVR